MAYWFLSTRTVNINDYMIIVFVDTQTNDCYAVQGYRLHFAANVEDVARRVSHVRVII